MFRQSGYRITRTLLIISLMSLFVVFARSFSVGTKIPAFVGEPMVSNNDRMMNRLSNCHKRLFSVSPRKEEGELSEEAAAMEKALRAKNKAVHLMEIAAAELEKTIEAATDFKKEEWSSIISDADASELAIHILEKATQAAAAEEIAKAERLVESSSAEAKEAFEEKKFALAKAAHAASEAAVHQKAIMMEHDIDEDTERRREMSSAHAATHEAEDSFAAAKEAEQKERKAKQDEANARAWIETVKRKEEEFKSAIDVLHHIEDEKAKQAQNEGKNIGS